MKAELGHSILFTIGLFGPLHLARARWVRGGRRQAGIQDAGTIIIVRDLLAS
jgi:hypothetical protein